MENRQEVEFFSRMRNLLREIASPYIEMYQKFIENSELKVENRVKKASSKDKKMPL
jgi:hypothetical protein